MKRYLYIVRHATAEDAISYFKDFERELTPSGIAEAKRMGTFLHSQGLTPDFIISSSASRAHRTAQIFGEQLGYDKQQIQTTRNLYDGGPRAYINAVNRAPESCVHLMLFGHNPDVSYLSEYLTNYEIESMAKGSVIKIEFEDLDWKEVSSETGSFVHYYEPHLLK